MEAVHNINTLRGTLEKNASLARFTSWKVGGAADLLFRPADLQDLRNFLATEDEIPLTWLGGGTNVLVRDGGIRGAVILLHGCLGQLEFAAPDRVRAEAGVACAKLARFCTDQQLQGAEFLIGIPGTVGGALAMNSGAFEHEIWEFVEHVETVDRRGELHTRNPDVSSRSTSVHMPAMMVYRGFIQDSPRKCEQGKGDHPRVTGKAQCDAAVGKSKLRLGIQESAAGSCGQADRKL